MSYEVFEGHLVVGGERLSVSFEAPVGATSAEKDSAFLSALAQQIEVNYLSMGEVSRDYRNVWREALDACYLEVQGDPRYVGGRTEVRMRSNLIAQEILKGYPDTLIVRDTYDTDEVFGECLVWMCSHFEFPNWEGRPLSLFLQRYGECGKLADKGVIQYPIQEPNRDGVKVAFVTLGELAAATPTQSGWRLPCGFEISFHQQPA